METSRERLRGAVLVCAAALCWSLGGLFVRLIGNHLDGWTIAFWRSAFMALTVGGWLLAANGLKAFADYRAMGWASVLSGLLLAVSFVMFILAITRTSVANAVVLQSAAPLASAILGRIFLREALTPPTLVAIVVAVAGVTLMFAGALGGGDLLGNALALGVAISFGANIVVVRAARELDLVPATVLAGLFAMGATLPLASLAAPSAYDLGLLAAMGTLQLGLGLFLFMRGAPYLTAAQVGLLTLLEVILAPIWVWLAFAEMPPPLSLGGGAVVLSALVAHSALSLRRSKPPVGMA
jgi:drug/metabolite transporter (DMT)-like permease